MKKIVKHINLNIYLNAALEENLSYKITFEDDSNYGYIHDDDKKVYFLGSMLGIEDNVHIHLVKNKFRLGEYLSKNNVPTPAQKMINIEDKIAATEFLKNSNKIVMKPNSLSKGRGVITNIENQEDLKKALKILKQYDDTILIQEQILGKDFRVFALEGEILEIVYREPAFIIGDGEQTIQELINLKNKNLHEYRNKIEVDNKLKHFLAKENLELNYIPDSDEKIHLRGNSNISEGGTPTKINLDNVHPDNIEMLEKTAFLSGIKIAGIDLLIEDISKSWKDQKSAIIEVNYGPAMRAHFLSQEKPSLEIPRKILRTIFESNKHGESL
jgi:cyanophycin synthetase